MDQPAGPNTVVLFKSCFPNSGGISGNPNDSPRLSSPADPNPIWGATAYDSDVVTVSNIKGLYRDLLSYFATRQDKLFILLTPPPVTSHPDQEFVPGSADRARAINTWLVHHWLDNYPYNNVAVFDFFNVLTSNNGDIDTNDLGLTTGNHHRLLAGQMQYVYPDVQQLFRLCLRKRQPSLRSRIPERPRGNSSLCSMSPTMPGKGPVANPCLWAAAPSL